MSSGCGWSCASLCLVLGACGARTGLPDGLRENPGTRDAAGVPRVSTPTAIPPSKTQARADKIDLLFVIDDSGSMQDKQTILSNAVPDLVSRLVNPLCVDPGTLAPAPKQPTSSLGDCSPGSLREFNSVQDLHIGVVTTSLGGVGAASCGAGIANSNANGHGHLVSPGGRSVGNFVAWNPGDPGASGAAKDPALFRTAVRNLVGIGESGCPYEMPLESMYRFLIDPEPYDKMTLATCAAGTGTTECAVQEGTDQELLRERAGFLRYDSLVAVVVLTDENDCSLTAGGQSFHVFDSPGQVPRATSQCAKDPNDRCCHGCGSADPAGCPASVSDTECLKGPYSSSEDSGLLRCFAQKRRLGADYLYPASRYVDGLTGKQVARRNGALVDNPLFHDPSGKLPPRDPSLVFAAGIVGVPWQDIAVNPSDQTALEFKSPEQMEADDTWGLILGDPERGVLPRDPLMIESTDERTGVQPVVGVSLAPSSSQDPIANPINGHETALGAAPSELQYACIFDLPKPESTFDCPGFSGSNRAICQAADGTYGSTQYRAKAFPGLRELEVLRGVGKNAIVASICSRNVKSEERDDYGYRPALRQILDRLRVGLN
jgi:hypothetical protein